MECLVLCHVNQSIEKPLTIDTVVPTKIPNLSKCTFFESVDSIMKLLNSMPSLQPGKLVKCKDLNTEITQKYVLPALQPSSTSQKFVPILNSYQRKEDIDTHLISRKFGKLPKLDNHQLISATGYPH